MIDQITFLASLAGTNTAARCLTVGHEGDAKLVLEISANDLGNVLKLLTLTGSTFRVQITPE